MRRGACSGVPARAAALLGRPYSISGHVLHGRKLGRTLGFPTLNIRIPFNTPAIAGFAVYLGHAHFIERRSVSEP